MKKIMWSTTTNSWRK